MVKKQEKYYSFSWANLRVNAVRRNQLHGFLQTLLDKTKRKSPDIILSSVNGKAEAGNFVAVIGPSGSGKTTFLNCIALRNQSNLRVRGKVYFNDREMTPLNAKYICSFIPQVTFSIIRQYILENSLNGPNGDFLYSPKSL